MDVYRIDPTQDARWAAFLVKHPFASVFHSGNWLTALRLTYGYRPIAFTTSDREGKIDNGAAFCLVRSWITGQRLVSLPFSDYCEPLFDSTEQADCLVQYLRSHLQEDHWKYVEVRPVNGHFGAIANDSGFRCAKQYMLHRIDLQPDSERLFKNLDKDSVQRRIRRAERAALLEECGNSEKLLRDFYALLIKTRSRHHVPPQPYIWFRNLVKCFGDALEIRLAYKDQTPVAAILTLRFKDTVYYKYGCSNTAFNNLGATPLLLWRAVSNAKATGAAAFDLGRTDTDNAGLIAFKNKWGSRSQVLTYLRFPGPSTANEEEWKLRVLKRVFSYMPAPLLQATGNLIYRHIG